MTNDSTVFDINGDTTQGATGLAQLAALGAAPTLVSASDAVKVFSIKYRGVVQLYTDFETFVAGLDERIADGQRAKNLHACSNSESVRTPGAAPRAGRNLKVPLAAKSADRRLTH